jgi:hypothetical protein
MLNVGEPSPEGAGGGEPLGDRRLADFDAAVAQIAARVLPAYNAGSDWLERTRAGLLALLRFCDERPELAKQVLLDSIAGGPAVLERRSQLLELLAGALDRGCEEIDPTRMPPPETAGNLVGACVSLIQTGLMCERDHALRDLGPLLMSTIAHPYLGPRAALRELEHSSLHPGGETAAHGPDAEAGEREPTQMSSTIRSGSY